MLRIFYIYTNSSFLSSVEYYHTAVGKLDYKMMTVRDTTVVLDGSAVVFCLFACVGLCLCMRVVRCCLPSIQYEPGLHVCVMCDATACGPPFVFRIRCATSSLSSSTECINLFAFAFLADGVPLSLAVQRYW